MGLKDNRRELWKTLEDEYYRRRLEERAYAPKHRMTLKKGIMHTNSPEDYDYNPSPGIV